MTLDNKENLMQICDIFLIFLKKKKKKSYICSIYQNRLIEAILIGCHNVKFNGTVVVVVLRPR